MTKHKRVREAALEILETIEREQAYSNLLLNNTIEKNEFSPVDAALLTEITYGTLQKQMTIDFYLAPFLKKQKKLENWVRQLLRLSVYQMAFLTKIPERAIFHEAVEIAKKRGHKGISSLVNGVLRSIQRSGFPSFNTIKDANERLAIETSHPQWLVNRWVKQFGFERTKAMCIENLEAPQQTARINEWLTSKDEVMAMLAAEGFAVEASDSIPNAIKSVKGNLVKSNVFKKGFITIQDESSMLVGFALAPKEGEKILDACAAPGGKTTHIGEKMKNTGEIIALDLHEHKIKLIRENATRLKLTNIKAEKMDSKLVDTHFPKESFDKILVDAPCSGLGVVKRKPDIKYSKREADIERLANIQLELLSHAADLVKKGGILVYSTCTVDRHENAGVAKKFLDSHPEFFADDTLVERMPVSIRSFVSGNQVEILPQDLKSDGFFIACFRKKV
ncbi:16S rRNA (cytosine(967)-C(5))-methyltransferase RsmB [Caldibacillus lycopersici]|uniref:16S rRNA (cytosine(967)-C(5))-methyltransferase n=1 Tax=Perspicuibacillus lycopersici TaxID=1325689 RepID=A0AAE3IPP6_9BACI|nr:16S rRNA (cytosine(967)-C(5))-methyltransferase RsmB [Perspicuibacillus lycopersici]MCU9612157.1 16S rRNA (cytosine(967)-C(5))-methyltransferase RsmB [Perspicuibacillus lycopersici]